MPILVDTAEGRIKLILGDLIMQNTALQQTVDEFSHDEESGGDDTLEECECLSEEEAVKQFPVLVTKVDGSQLSREELQNLADFIRRSFCPAHGRARLEP